MPCEIASLNDAAGRVDYQTRDQERKAIFLRER